MTEQPPIRGPLPFTTDPDPVVTPEPAGDDALLARQHLLSAAGSPELALQSAFVTAAEGRRDPTFLPLVRSLYPESHAVKSLELEQKRSTSSELLEGIIALWDAMCAEEWVSDPGLCRSIRVSFSSARAALAENDPRTLRAALSALLVNVGAARGRGVRAEGYLLVKGTVDAILGRL